MNKEMIHLDVTTSTNDYLKNCPTPAPDHFVMVRADFQSAGRGQKGNTWESNAGENLLTSILTSPKGVRITEQFVLSMAGALAVKSVLDNYCGAIKLKWPNDIYWFDSKISGTLIETAVSGKEITRCIFGIGLNVNQEIFRSDAPNPISLLNITGLYTPIERVANELAEAFDAYYQRVVEGDKDAIVSEYNNALYRRFGLHRYEDTATGETFLASIDHVGTDGMLRLTDENGRQRAYSLKEVMFVLR